MRVYLGRQCVHEVQPAACKPPISAAAAAAPAAAVDAGP